MKAASKLNYLNQENTMERPNWDEYFLNIADLVATRSTCIKKKSGAILVRDRRILTTGYSGAPKGLAHCLDVGCLRDRFGIANGEKLEFCRGIHATQNAIIQGAIFGVSTKDSVLYTQTLPCIICVKLLINAGVKKIVIRECPESKPKDVYELTLSLLHEAEVEIVVLKGA